MTKQLNLLLITTKYSNKNRVKKWRYLTNSSPRVLQILCSKPMGFLTAFVFSLSVPNVAFAQATNIGNSCSVPFVQTFGTSPTPITTLPAGVSTTYTLYDFIGGVQDGQLVLAANPGELDGFSGTDEASTVANAIVRKTFKDGEDHTPGDTNGLALVVNADFAPGEFYRQSFSGLLIGNDYNVEYKVANIIDRNVAIAPNILTAVTTVGGSTAAPIASTSSGDISVAAGPVTWETATTSFTATTTSVDLVLVNNAPGGSGNDLMIDDISFSLSCTPISAAPESFSSIDGTLGGSTSTVLAGDMFGGATASLATVDITVLSSTDASKVSLDPMTGLITVAAGTTAGDYDIEYQICDDLNNTNCATATETITVTAPAFTPYVLAQPSNICEANYASWEFAPTGAAGDPAHAGTAFVDAGYTFDASGTPLYPSTPAPTTGSINQTTTVQVPELALGKGEPETYTLATRLEFTPNTTRTVVIRDERRFEHHIYELRGSDGTVLAFEPEFYGGTAADKSYTVSVPADGVVFVYAWVVDFEQRNQTSFPVSCKYDNSLVTTKTFGSPTALGDGTFTLPVTITAENQGNVALNNLQITDALNAASNFGSAFKSVTVAPSVSVTDVAGTPLIGTDVVAVAPSAATPAFDGTTNTNLFSGNDGALGVGDSLTVTFTVRLDANDASAPAILKNTASVSGVDPSGETRTDLTGGGASDTGSPTVFQRFMTADNDTLATPVNSATAQTGVINVLDGDMLNAATIDSMDVTLSSADIPTGFTLNQDGTVDIAAGTTAGDYSFTYKVCEDGVTPENCATATVEITVEAPSADLSITKTNTPGVNSEVDQAADTVTSGQNTTYTLVVKNNGPDSVTGAVVTDTPTSGLTCAGTNTVSITGDGVPTGTFTIADLTGAGIALDTLADGQSTTLTFSCEVN